MATSPMAGSSPGEASHQLLLLSFLQTQSQHLSDPWSPSELSDWQAASSPPSRASPPAPWSSHIWAVSPSLSYLSPSPHSRPKIPTQLRGSLIQTKQLLIKCSFGGILCSPGISDSGVAGGSPAIAGLSGFFFSSSQH